MLNQKSGSLKNLNKIYEIKSGILSRNYDSQLFSDGKYLSQIDTQTENIDSSVELTRM